MSDKSKIVELHSSSAKDAPPGNLPAAIAALESKCRAFLCPRFAQVLDDLDDRFFELADEASTAKEQQLYFDAMHEARVKRTDMETRFQQALADAYVAMLQGTPQSASERGQAKLKVLESDALEELVALEGMAKKAERRYMQEIWQLCTAWQHAVNGPAPPARDLPMGPAKISKALTAALEGVRLDIKAKLVLLRLFERQLMGGYGELCEQLRPVLEAHGLPSEGAAAIKKDAAPTPDATPSPTAKTGAAPTQNDAVELANKLFDTLEQLLSPVGDDGEDRLDRMVLSKPSLMVALQDMQNEQYSSLNVRRAVTGNAAAQNDMVRQLISRLNQVNRVSSADASALSVQRDRDTIQFVGALFQYILEGDGLSDELKAVIARLQIPILKMAMLDKNFFSHDEHPARKLLSSLLSAGIGWAPTGAPEKDPLYRKVEQIVMRVLRDFGVDTQVFVDVYEEFQHFSEKDRRRAELVARRTVDAADGRAMAEQARSYIGSFLDQKLAEHSYPPVVATLLRDGWAKVLFLSYVQAGRESARFADDLKTAERLLWSVAPSHLSSHRGELIDTLPALVDALRDGFNRASLSAFETSQWFEQLERLHLAKLSRSVAPEGTPSQRERVGDSDLRALDAGLASGLGETAASSSAETSTKPTEDVFTPAAPQPSDEVQSKLASLRVGNWVDFRQQEGEGGRMVRCRLAAVINGIGKYIFVNRAGVKVAELNRQELESAIAEQRLFLIEDGRLFDRALESVISNLRDLKDKPLE